MKKPHIWDNYSDQPEVIKDKNYKRDMRKNSMLSFSKTVLTSLVIIPYSLVMTPLVRRKEVDSSQFFCLGIDYEREPQLTLDIVNELKIKRVLLRIKLWELDSLTKLKDFIKKIKDKKVTLKILQDRENITDLKLLKKNLDNIFSTLDGLIDIYEIGSTINRAKWGFANVDEYNNFYKVAYDLKQDKFPDIKLIGSGVIDFEYHFTAHTLFNFFKYKYDGISSLLYVDRRGAPENLQLGFSLSDKIALLSTMVWLSPKSKQVLHITETNWPLKNTAPYAPTSELECVDEQTYANFMLRYHLFAFASQQVDSVSWHQLIAPGYGLIDNRDGIKYYTAFQTYKFMIENLQNAQFLRLDIKRGYYILQCLVDEKLLQIHWSLKDTTLKKEKDFQVFSRDGKIIADEILSIGSSPIYIYITTKTEN